MHHEIEEKLTSVKELKEKLVDIAKAEFNSKSVCDIDAKEMGEVIDMIKDLAEVEEKCWKGHYYKTVSKAMEENEESNMRYGYNHRHTASGRFASAGRGHRVGYYDKMMPMEMRYDMEYLDDPEYFRDMMNDRMGYDGRSASRSGNMNMGGNRGSDGYTMNRENPRHGKAYNEFMEARRHYTATNSPEHKMQMDEYANEHMNDTIASIKEIWKSADPAMRKNIKADLTKLVGEMPV